MNAVCSIGLVRKPAEFISSIVDERGSELVYAGMKISEVINQGVGAFSPPVCHRVGEC